MDIEDSSVPYRAFLRSGSYPAMTQRVMRSGSVLAQAAGWFALVVTAASAGYNLTQRLVTPTSAAAGNASYVRPALKPAHASGMDHGQPSAADEHVDKPIVRETLASAAQAATAKPQSVAGKAPASPAAAVRKRAGATAGSQGELPATADPTIEASPHVMEHERAERIAERVRALDTASHVAAAERAAVPAKPASDPIEELLRAGDERERAAAAAHVREQPVPMPARASMAPSQPARAPAATPSQPARAPAATPSQPLVAAARVDGVSVRGPLSAAQLRRSVERVRPTLSVCYADAARRAGHNLFSQVRVVVTIDEAGRVKTHPKVDGAQLPGFGECLSSAMSKLVCQAPDTGTATAAILLGFSPER